MSLGKNFNLFLIDGEVTGRIKCTLSNWTGLAYKIPRSYLEKSKERQDLKQSGVYLLIEKNELFVKKQKQELSKIEYILNQLEKANEVQENKVAEFKSRYAKILEVIS